MGRQEALASLGVFERLILAGRGLGRPVVSVAYVCWTTCTDYSAFEPRRVKAGVGSASFDRTVLFGEAPGRTGELVVVHVS